MSDIRQALATLGLEIPATVAAAGSYAPCVRHGQSLHVSGQLPRRGAQIAYIGRIGRELTLEQGQEAARLSVLRLLLAASDAAAAASAEIDGMVELTVFVSGAEGFTEHSRVADAASELVLQVLGRERGRHARAAVGVAQLPGNAAVEIKGILSLFARP